MYALASDQPIRRGKVAAIVSEIGVVNGWFAIQTIGRVQPRWVRKVTAAGSVGDPKVLTVRLAHTAAQYEAAVGGDILDMVEADLAAAAPAKSSSERAAVWIDVDSAYACGITRPKEVTVLLEASCNIPAELLETWPYGGTYLLAHELTHNFGAAPDCAPHSMGSGHVDDDPRDVVFAGRGDRDWDHLMLDPGHDDYYATGRTDCEDMAASPFWTRTSAPGS